jgi:hypothetical protein
LGSAGPCSQRRPLLREKPAGVNRRVRRYRLNRPLCAAIRRRLRFLTDRRRRMARQRGAAPHPIPAIPTESSFRVDACGCHAKEIAMDMDSAEHCRAQAEECRRQRALAQNEAEISILTYLSRSWVMIAGQIDRYVEIGKKEK